MKYGLRLNYGGTELNQLKHKNKMEKELTIIISLVGVIFISLIFIHLVMCHIILIRHAFFKKEYPKKVLITAFINCLPSIILCSVFFYWFKYRKIKKELIIQEIDNDEWWK